MQSIKRDAPPALDKKGKLRQEVLSLNRSVSAIIPFYGDARAVGVTLASVARQLPRKALEIIIVDCQATRSDADASADERAARQKRRNLVSRYSRLRKTVVASLDVGSARNARLAGAAMAHGDYLLFLNEGDALDGSLLGEALVLAEAAGADLAVADTAVKWPGDKGVEAYSADEYRFRDDGDFFADYLERAPEFWAWYFLGNKVIRRDLWERVVGAVAARLEAVGKPRFYGEDLTIATALWREAQRAIRVAGKYVAFDWDKEDAFIKEAMVSPMEVIKDVKSSLDFLYECLGEDDEAFFPVSDAFVRRFWWRSEWTLRGEAREKAREELERLFYVDDLEYAGDGECVGAKVEREGLFEKEEEYVSAKEIHVYVAMHKEAYVPRENRYIVPIQVGAALSEERFEGMAHDDEGDNISEKNRRYCELTGQYWAYKNDAGADYYGFWHYRRYFAFSEDAEDEWGVISCESLNEESLKRFLIDEPHIAEAVDNYDIIVPPEWECVEEGKKYTIHEHWSRHLQREDLDLTIKLVLKKYPLYYDALMSVLYSDRAIFCNMFIMKKELFQEYSAFLFDILAEFERESDHSRYNIEQFRTIGHIAERLLAVYVRFIESARPETRVLYLSKVLFNDTRPYAVVKPLALDGKVISIVLACNDAYMRYTDVLLRSILDNANADYRYDVVIMHRDVSEQNIQTAKDIFSGNDNFTLRFADITRNFEKYKRVHVDRHLTVETYYRFLVTDVFKEYDRVLYLDCDMVVNADISALYFTDLEGYYAAAVRDIDFIAKCVKDTEFCQKNVLRYVKIDDYFDYFQAGMILFNVSEIRKRFTSEKLFETALSRNWFFHDQDVLNHLFKGRVKYVDFKWNLFSLLETGSAREMLVRDYLAAGFAESYWKAINNPGIVHFAGVPKVWDDLDVNLSHIFWKYARRSPYYETLLKSMLIGDGKETGWFIFYGERKAENTGVKFFRIVNSGDVWNSVLCAIDFMYCTGENVLYTDTLLVNAQLYPHEQYSAWLNVQQFHWEKGLKIFTENIGFTVDNAKSITIWARYISQFQGFSFSARILESRNIEKPKIVIENRQFVRETVELPKEVRYGGGGLL
ncbi:MAG: DUF4422 domain-containing protein [Treponema sp.]|jgi:lipopolysaccharide biosynthesis glycosyltransferase|nr:DUF4422 domain-containing protein [Treponema sp.]